VRRKLWTLGSASSKCSCLSGEIARKLQRTIAIALHVGRIGQVWHEQMRGEAGHRWLREVIAQACRTV
jgi:hypothetical protein